MSIDLNIDLLETLNSQLEETVSCFDDNEQKCRSSASSLVLSWTGDSYEAFQSELLFILNGIYTQSLDDAKTFSQSLTKVEKKARSLKKQAESLPSILSSGQASCFGAGGGVLYCDDDQVTTIDSTIESAKELTRTISSNFSALAAYLQTISVYIDEEGISFYTSTLDARLDSLKSATGEISQGISDIESSLTDAFGDMTGDRFLASNKAGAVIDVDGNLADPEVALLLFRTPKHLLSPAELKLVEQMEALGYSERSLLSSQGPSIYTGIGLVDDVLGGTLAAGRATIIKVNGKDVTLKTFTKFGRATSGIGIALGVADTMLTYDRAYTSTPELATGRRISNAQVEGAISAGESLTAVAAPLIGGFAGGPIGIAIGSVVSVAVTLGSDALWDSTIRVKNDNGRSWVDDRKNAAYDAWHKKQ